SRPTRNGRATWSNSASCGRPPASRNKPSPDRAAAGMRVLRAAAGCGHSGEKCHAEAPSRISRALHPGYRNAMTYSLAVDIGGTFTDIVLRHSDGRLIVDKTLTTPHDLIEGFFHGVHAVLAKARVGPRDVDGVVVHATTIVTNTLIERKGPPTALVVTEGFSDVLVIRNEHRYEMYDPQI